MASTKATLKNAKAAEGPKRSGKAWVAWTNTDLTEGRGGLIPKAICKAEATARRLGKGGSVQGSDCSIEHVELFSYDGKTYGPVHVVYPSKEDERYQVRLDEYRATMAKARELGLDPDQLAILMKGHPDG